MLHCAAGARLGNGSLPAVGGGAKKLDPKEKIKRGLDEWRDILAAIGAMYPDAADPFEALVKEISANGVYGETEIAELAEIQQEYASAWKLLGENDSLDPEQTERLLTELARIGDRFRALAPRLAEWTGRDVTDYVPDEDDEK